MALAANQQNWEISGAAEYSPAEIVPMPSNEDLFGSRGVKRSNVQQAVEAYRERAGRVMHETKLMAARLYGRARTRAAAVYAQVSRSARSLARDARARAHYLKQERPLQTLALIAAAAFATGVAIRIWRSQNS